MLTLLQLAAADFFALLKKWQKIFADVIEARLQTAFLINAPDFCFDRGGVSENAQEVVGCESGEGFAVNFSFEPEKPFAYEESQHGVPHPRFSSFEIDFSFAFFLHFASRSLLFFCLRAHPLAHGALTFGVPVVALQLDEDAGVWQSGFSFQD